jgi:hypothetical protein
MALEVAEIDMATMKSNHEKENAAHLVELQNRDLELQNRDKRFEESQKQINELKQLVEELRLSVASLQRPVIQATVVTNEASSSSLIESSNISEAVDASWELTTISPIEGVLLTVPPVEGVLLDQQQAKAFLPGKVFEGGESGVGEESNVISPMDTSPGTPQEIIQGSPVLVAPQSPPVTMAPQSPADFGDSPDATEEQTPPKSPRSASSKLRQFYHTFVTKRSPSAKR